MSDTPLPQTAEAPASGSFGRLSRLALPGLPQFWRTLQAPNATLLAAGLIVPNLLSLASLSTLVDIGLPPRSGAIFLYAVLAILARRTPFAGTVILYLAVLAYDIVRTLSLMFGLAPSELMLALDHARRINFFASPLYAALIGALTATTLAALYLLSRRSKLIQGNIYILFGATVAFAALDYVSNVSAHYQFGSMFGRDKPVVSAGDLSGFNDVAGTNGRNVVVVVVESLGYMTDPAARARIAAPLFDEHITQK